MPKKGYKQTPDHITKKYEAQKGTLSHKWCDMTPEQQQRNRDNLNRMIENNKGKHRLPSIVKKITESNTGKRRSPEFRRRMVEVATGRCPSKETRIKMGNSRRGEKNGRWLGGVSFEPYCPKFTNEFKERVRTFFNHTCQVCMDVWQPGETKLSVHHVNYNKKSCCDDTKPLFVPVCVKCHSKTNTHREYWDEIFTNMIMIEHNGECYLPKGCVR